MIFLRDASEILNISLCSQMPTIQIKILLSRSFLELKSNWLIKDSNFELIEEYLH